MTQVNAWAAKAEAGDVFAYHRAAVHKGRQVGQCRAKPYKTAADKVACEEADDALALYHAGLVHLLQRRTPDGLDYIAVRR